VLQGYILVCLIASLHLFPKESHELPIQLLVLLGLFAPPKLIFYIIKKKAPLDYSSPEKQPLIETCEGSLFNINYRFLTIT
jgi:hypothetical protein